VAGCCEHGNEPSVSVKAGNVLISRAEWPSSGQEGLCSMQLGGQTRTLEETILSSLKPVIELYERGKQNGISATMVY
jgi:hypothetical protein